MHYGYIRTPWPGDAQTQETVVCAACYRRAYAGVGRPSRLARGVLGYRPVTTKAQAHTLTCQSCQRTLA